MNEIGNFLKNEKFDWLCHLTANEADSDKTLSKKIILSNLESFKNDAESKGYLDLIIYYTGHGY